MHLIENIGRRLARFLGRPSKYQTSVATCKHEEIAQTLRKGDVLLVEGVSRISNAVKYLTQSTWSHAALCTGLVDKSLESGSHELQLLEADVLEGVRRVPLSEHWDLHTRICRPVGLSTDQIDQVIRYTESRLGDQYDLKNIFDLARYLIQTPPVPNQWKRRMLALGSGDPTRAICSSLVAQAFQSVHYPILPEVENTANSGSNACYEEILHIRHHSLFAPRDFDISPYFQIIKPTLELDFNPGKLTWATKNPNNIEQINDDK